MMSHENPSSVAVQKSHRNKLSGMDRVRRGAHGGRFRLRPTDSDGTIMSSSTQSTMDDSMRSQRYLPPPGFSVPPPPSSLRSSMNSSAKSLDDSLGHRGLSRSRRRGEMAAELASATSSVSFGTIRFRHYERIPGDNPSICFGVPLAIGWRYNEDDTDPDGPLTVDAYEARRNRPPKSREELYVGPTQREAILKEEWGISRSALQEAERKVMLASKLRRETAERMHLAKAQEAMESTRNRFNRLVGRRRPSKEEENLWKQARRLSLSDSQQQQIEEEDIRDASRHHRSRTKNNRAYSIPGRRKQNNIPVITLEEEQLPHDDLDLDRSNGRLNLLSDNKRSSGRTLPISEVTSSW